MTMLVRAAWRRYWRASVFLVVVAGLAAGVVGASFQAASRADTSLERFARQSRTYDLLVQACPPGTDPKIFGDFAATLKLCVDPKVTARFRRVLDRMKAVERTAMTSTMVVALLDPSVSNHWGRLTLLAGIRSPDAPAPPLRPIIVSGRLYNPDASDEIVVTETAAQAVGLHVGQHVRMASWHQTDLDAAVDGSVAPQTPPFDSRIVGIVRGLEDVQANDTGTLSDATIPGNLTLVAGPGWMAAHGADLPGYGSAVMVQLRGGESAVKAFRAELDNAPEGWLGEAQNVSDTDPTSVRRVIDLERRALLVFAIIAIAAGVAFVGLTTVRQLRRESAESGPLFELGMTRRDLRAVNVVRALTIGVPASAVALVSIVALSPLGPLGIARKLEFDTPVRFDAVLLASTALALLTLFTVSGLLTPIDAQVLRSSRVPARRSRRDPVARSIGPVAAVGAAIARGRSSHVAIAVTAIAVASGVAAGCVVASYDRLIADPQRYGASWDLAVGQYSQPGPLAEGIARLRANPAVVAAAGYFEQPDIAAVNGQRTLVVAMADYIGHRAPVIARGHVPAAADEVALGRNTARRIHKGIGDQVEVRWTVNKKVKRLRLHVVGIVVVNDPINPQAAAGNGIFVRPGTFARINGRDSVAQSIVIALDPHRDRVTAIESVRRDFSGSIREAIPQVDARNLGRLRSVPWLIAGLIGILALATLVHALVTILGRNRTTLAVLAALGFTRRQRRSVGLFASVALVLVGIAIGVPFGLVIGARVWSAVSDGIDLPSASVPAWLSLVVASIGAIALAALVALATSRGTVRMTPSEQLRVE